MEAFGQGWEGGGCGERQMQFIVILDSSMEDRAGCLGIVGRAGQAASRKGAHSRSRGFCPILGLTSPARASGSLAIGFCLDEAHAT